ncbi:MAG: SDR family NAD(P)-dependent oxidoreductase [Anaerolineales bacterium]|nr:MAG: SDR family NAD(P)-dependent oxidoreductase [Anaerolineales bacterium]
MKQIALVTGADRGLGLALCMRLIQHNWIVFAGQYMPEWPELEALSGRYPARLHCIPLDVSSEQSAQAAVQTVGELVEHVDLLISNAGVTSPTMHATLREPQDYSEIHRLFDVNALGALRIVEAFLPMLDNGAMKRLCFVSSEAGSIERCQRESWFGYTMSKAALNMAVKTMFNHLRPAGYTFRLYHPGWMRTYMGGTKNTRGDMEPEEAAEYAITYFLSDLAADPLEPQNNPEDRLVLRDWLLREWPW